MKYLVSCFVLLLLSACGKPAEISEADYAKYKELGSPKILYSCTQELGVSFEVFASCNAVTDIGNKTACFKRAMADSKKKTTRVDYEAGVGLAVTYNELLLDAKKSCEGEFKILDSKT